MFQTRGDCSGDSAGTVTFTSAAGKIADGDTNIILNNLDKEINTCAISASATTERDYNTCGLSGDCNATGTSGSSLSINYVNAPQVASISKRPTSSTNDILLDGTIVRGSEYNEITTNYNIRTTFDITDKLEINFLKMTSGNTFSFTSSSSYSLAIGILGIQYNSAVNSISTDDNAVDINISKFTLASSTELTLTASETIKMENFTVGSGSTVTLKAPYVNINYFDAAKSGSGDSNITIYADYIDIGNLDLYQNVTLTVYPYTDGERVLFRTNTLDESSTSTFLLSTGNYYVNTSLTIPGTSNVSALRAVDENQLINLYINNDLTLGNNPGINVIGNNGDYDSSNSAANFLLFVNGDLTTRGGGTTINATIYVEGNATFGSSSYIKGAVSAENITINAGQFTYEQNLEEEGWGDCGSNDPNFEYCGLFPSALNTWNNLSGANGSDVEVIYVDPPTLPTYLFSAVNTSKTAISLETNAEYGDLTVTGGDSVTFTPGTNYYLSGSKGVMLIKSLSIGADATVTFSEGDYYIQDLSGSGKITIITRGAVRLFIKNDVDISGNNLAINEGEQASNLIIFVYGDFLLSSNGGGAIQNTTAYLYVEGTFTANQNTSNSNFTGAISSNGGISLANNQIYAYDSTGLNGTGFGSCATFYLSGPFGAWDPIHHNTSTPPSNRNISTKIVNKPFSVSLASLNTDNDAYETKSGADIYVAIYPYGSTTRISNEISFDVSSTNQVESSSSFTVSSAEKDAVVGFKFCATYMDSLYTIYASASCSGASVACTTQASDTPTFHVCPSTDHLAIRPEKFTLSAPSGADIELLTAGTDYNLSLIATQYGLTTPSADYNVTSANAVLDINKTIYDRNDNADGSLLGTLSFAASTFNISNGSALDVGVNFTDVGKVNIIITDESWADVDADDTIGECSDTGRYICGDINATFIPADFAFSLVTLHNSNDSTFTYISNDLNISSSLGFTITARNSAGVTTQNFNTGSWENPVNVDLSVPAVATMTSHQNDINETLNLDFASGVLTVLSTESNTSKNIIFNFERNVSDSKNPFQILGSDVDLNASSLYTSSSSATATVSGVGVSTQTANFIYGRTNAPRSRFLANDNQQAFIYYEAYCDDGCDRSLLPNGVSSIYTNDPRWFVNTLHSGAIFGTAGNVTQNGANLVSTNIEPAGTHTDSATITYNGNNGNPYKTTMQNNASSWLIYNKFNAADTTNEFEVEFEETGSSWAGRSDTNVTTDRTGTEQVNRRSMW